MLNSSFDDLHMSYNGNQPVDLRSFAQPSHVQAPVAAEMVHNAHDKSWAIVHSERGEFESQLILITIESFGYGSKLGYQMTHRNDHV